MHHCNAYDTFNPNSPFILFSRLFGARNPTTEQFNFQKINLKIFIFYCIFLQEFGVKCSTEKGRFFLCPRAHQLSKSYKTRDRFIENQSIMSILGVGDYGFPQLSGIGISLLFDS